MKKNIFIHTGMHKSGSSYLQNEIFTRIPEFYFISFFIKSEPSNPIIEFFLFTKKMKKNRKNEFREKINKFINSIPEKNLIISSEMLNGNPLNGFEDQEENIAYLSYFFKNAKIILVTRKKFEYLESLYRHQIKIRKRSFSFKDFYTYHLPIQKINYKLFYNNYLKYFPRENILFLPYELLKDNRNIFLSKIFTFMKSEWLDSIPLKNVFINRSLSKPSIMLIRMKDLFPTIFKIIFFPFYSYLFLLENFLFILKASVLKKILINSIKKLEFKFLLRNILDKNFYIKGKICNKKHKTFIYLKQKKASDKALPYNQFY